MHVWNLDRYMSKKFCLNFQYYLKIVLGAWSLNFDGRNFKIFTMKITYVLWKIMLLWNFWFFSCFGSKFLELRRFHRWYFFRIIQGNDWIVTTLKCWLMAASWRCLKFWQLLFIWSLFRFIGENGQNIDEFDKIDELQK